MTRVCVLIIFFISGSIFGEILHQAPEIDLPEQEGTTHLTYEAIPNLQRAYFDFTPDDRNDGLAVDQLVYGNHIKELVNEIADGKFGQYDSLLIAHEQQLVFESYYHKGRVNLPHYQASTTKTYTSLAVGRAIKLGYLSMADLHKPILDFLPEIDRRNLIDGADSVTLHHALSMQSGIRLNRQSFKDASKKSGLVKGKKLVEAYLTHSLPIDEKSQTYMYQSIDTRIVMIVLDSIVPSSAREFIETELLQKLFINNYHWGDDKSGVAASAYGVNMTARDMLKWGILIEQNGMWQGEALISPDYLQQARSNIAIPVDEEYDYGKFRYGYYFWNTQWKSNDEIYHVSMAWGGGGQYIITVEALNLVIAITANIRKSDQTFALLKQHVLPTFALIENLKQKRSFNVTGPYLGQTLSGLKAEVFAPGIVNTIENREIEGMFSPDMKAFYFIRRPIGEKPESNILTAIELKNDQWQLSQVKKGISEPSVGPNGKRLYVKRSVMDITKEGWSEPKPLGAPFDSIDIMRLSASSNQTYYFDTFNPELDIPIRYARLINGHYESPKSLGPQFGVGKYNAHPYIAPDESYIIFDSRREGGYGSSDLYISFRDTNGSWGPAINLGDNINSADAETYPSLSSDEKYIFFDRRTKQKVKGVKQVDIYWADAQFIQQLREQYSSNLPDKDGTPN